MNNAAFHNIYKDKIVLITGHTGLKGSWLTLWLLELGAKVIGFSLDNGADDGIFQLAKIKNKITHINGDVRNLPELQNVFSVYQPELLFHLAAQALVRRSYEDPVTTFETNVLGTLNVLECIRQSSSIKTAILVTSDKCYQNREGARGYRENDPLGGDDPYSASKGSAELVIRSYWESFLKGTQKKMASVRAGNVIGGGDWSKDRLVPDAIKALANNQPVSVRNPSFVRPWQHVLEPLSGYLLLGSKLENNYQYCGAWNFGPSPDSHLTVKKLVESLIERWGEGTWVEKSDSSTYKESRLLNLDSTKARMLLGWNPVLTTDDALNLTVNWYKEYKTKEVYDLTKRQIDHYCELKERGEK